jgi:hypothetical protein
VTFEADFNFQKKKTLKTAKVRAKSDQFRRQVKVESITIHTDVVVRDNTMSKVCILQKHNRKTRKLLVLRTVPF